MSKIAFIYPGQGAQKCGMGEDFYKESAIAREIFDEASQRAGFDVSRLCFEENEQLDQTNYTQIAMVTTCLAMTREIMARGLYPDYTAGLSLGEYAAIAAAEGMSDIDAISTVWVRGNLMQNAVEEGFGGMAAVLGLSGEDVKAAVDTIEGITVANYNCPGQVVITGKKEAMPEAEAALKDKGAKRVLPLNVSGPFHSPYLKEAGEQLFETLTNVEWNTLQIPYAANVNGKVIRDIKETPGLLKNQVSGSVMWEQDMRALLEEGVDTFIEIGPGKTLSGFMKKIQKGVQMYKIGTMEEMEQVIDALKNREDDTLC